MGSERSFGQMNLLSSYLENYIACGHCLSLITHQTLSSTLDPHTILRKGKAGSVKSDLCKNEAGENKWLAKDDTVCSGGWTGMRSQVSIGSLPSPSFVVLFMCLCV